MPSQAEKSTQWPLWKGLVVLIALVIIPVSMFTWLALTSDSTVEKEAVLPTTHALFGTVFQTTATFGPPVRLPNTSLTRTITPLVLGSNQMTWMKEEVDGKPAGYLYFEDPARMTSNVWSFAPCARTNLDQVTKADLHTAFCSADEDEKGRNMFGSQWVSGHRSTAIWVQQGDVMLATHLLDPSVTYVLEMTKQEEHSLLVRYVKIAQ